MCPDGYLKTSSQTYFLMIMNLGHRFISAYSKWHSYTAQNNFCPVTTSLIKCQFLLQISCLYKQRPKQITVANVHHSEHLLVSVQRMVSLEQSMSLLLKIQVTWSFWKKKKKLHKMTYLGWWFAYPHFNENSACSLLFSSHATIQCCHMWPYYLLEKNGDYVPRFLSFKIWFVLWPWK